MEKTLNRLFRPIVKFLLMRGINFSQASKWLKKRYVEVAESDFTIEGKRLTDSRLSVITGINRKEIKALRAAEPAMGGQEPRSQINLLSRVVAKWVGTRRFTDELGNPRALPRDGEEGPSFRELVSEVSRDVHPRTILDEMERLGAIDWDRDADEVGLTGAGLVPSGDDEMLIEYLGLNVGDHLQAAIGNVAAAPDPGPWFERAVHYNRLSDGSVQRLKDLAASGGDQLLRTINAEAHRLQDSDSDKPGAVNRFRFGAYFFSKEDDRSEEGEEY